MTESTNSCKRVLNMTSKQIIENHNNLTKIHRPKSICLHLAAEPEDFTIWFTGQGIDCAWICGSCASTLSEAETSLTTISDELYATFLSDFFTSNVVGRPEIKYQQTNLRFEHYSCQLDQDFLSQCIDIQPNPKADKEWFVLLATGEIATLHSETKEITILCRIDISEYSDLSQNDTMLCVSAKQDYAAVFGASKQYGVVFDFKTGRTTYKLDRGAYHINQTDFPICFFEVDGKSILVASTRWNRVDMIDPGTGTILSEREVADHKKGEPRPPHYLDYFHGRLSVSPKQDYIVDDGWVWSPAGLVRTWSLTDWLKNRWESEDGESFQKLAQRHHLWEMPSCWIDDYTILVWGWGDTDDSIIPAARAFDVRSARELYWFPGPEVRPESEGKPKKIPPSFFFDHYLFSVSTKCGVQVWNPKTGEQLCNDPSISPIQYHPLSKEFLSKTSDGFLLSQLKTSCS